MTTIGTWNLENLFRPGGTFGPSDEASYRAKLAALAATINTTKPDVLGVQEVGDPDALADLVAMLDGEWHVELSKHFEADHPIRVGVLSRRPIQVIQDAADFPEKLASLQVDDSTRRIHQMGRGALAVGVDLASGQQLVVTVCHLKSKLLSYPAASGGTRFFPRNEGERARYASYALFRRAAEAITVRALTDHLLDDHLLDGHLLDGHLLDGQARQVVVLGDLNDEPLAATTQILLGPPGSEIGTPGALVPDRGDAARLWNLAPLIPEGERFSRVYQGRHELIDHIMVSRSLLDRVDEVHTLSAAGLPSVGDDPVARRDARASDHSPVLAQLAI
jgi:endonuclease/exonuclease/phosphatase family metal-dependent hydrolase